MSESDKLLLSSKFPVRISSESFNKLVKLLLGLILFKEVVEKVDALATDGHKLLLD